MTNWASLQAVHCLCIFITSVSELIRSYMFVFEGILKYYVSSIYPVHYQFLQLKMEVFLTRIMYNG